MLNQVTIIGRTCNDIQLHQFDGGGCVGNVSVAINEKKKDKSGNMVDHTEFVRCVLWNKTAELVAQYVPKGRLVCFVGKLQTSDYEKDGVKHFKTEVIVREMKFIPNGNGGNTQTNQEFANKPADNGAASGDSSAFDNIPF